MAGDNKTLGRFMLDGIPPAPRGLPQVEVMFDIDANGILKVSAKDKGTGKEQSIRIEASSGLSSEDIAKMKKEADMHASDDEKKKQLAEARNMADTLIYASEKALRDAGDKVPADMKQEIEGKITALKKAKDEAKDAETLKSVQEDLSRSVQKIGEMLYKKPDSGDNKTEGGTAKEARDADYREVKDDNEKK